ncbi:helix-turn-helix domain-containing protein [Oligoflexus tunisiensis]|uniref:helix-turn-helix domain-containing protein n=1 Tax=Oligoflexus tunisiensis TaxID=708132 RepID=UPI00114CCC5D|nr:helix-turn-helix transcriptional regulator [Oligoflexus tunisiensis]
MSFADLIKNWLDAHPSRTSARLAKLTEVSPAEISAILRGHTPSLDVAARLGSVLPVEAIVEIVSRSNRAHQKFFDRILSGNAI